MSKMPSHIASNPIYAWIWGLIRRKEQNAVFLFIGDVGKGKSTGAMRWAEDLDRGFSVERICFSMAEFFKLVNDGDSNGKLKRGSAIIFDEPAGSKEGLDSREHYMETNRMASQFTTISRAKGYIIFYCVPLIGQLDKRVRSIGVKGVCDFRGVDYKEKVGRAAFYYNYISGFATKEMRPKPRTRKGEGKRLSEMSDITIPLPQNAELIRLYKKKKDDFIDRKVAQWKKETAEMGKVKDKGNYLKDKCEEAKEKLSELTTMAGDVSVALIRVKLDVGESTAKNIKTVLIEEGVDAT